MQTKLQTHLQLHRYRLDIGRQSSRNHLNQSVDFYVVAATSTVGIGPKLKIELMQQLETEIDTLGVFSGSARMSGTKGTLPQSFGLKSVSLRFVCLVFRFLSLQDNPK